MTKGTVSQSGNRLNADTAKGLAVSPGVVSLSYKSFSSAAAKALAAFQGKRIELEELPRMDEQSARNLLHLAEAGRLSIAWIRAQRHIGHIERSTILALARYADSVDLDGIHDLTANEANALADFEGVQILLYLERLDKKTAVNLAKASPELLHVSVKHATDAALIALSESNATEELQIRLESGSLSARSASALSGYRGDALSITLSKTPITYTLRALALFNGHLSLHIPILTPFVARTLVHPRGTIELQYSEASSQDVIVSFSNSSRVTINHDGDIE